MKKFLWGFIIIFFASLVLSPPIAGSLRAQEPTEEDTEEPTPIERVLPSLAPVEPPIPKPTVIQTEPAEKKPEEKIGRELPGLAPVDPPEIMPEIQRQTQDFPALPSVIPPEITPFPQRQIQQFPALSPVTPPEVILQPERQIQQFPALSPVPPPEQIGEVQRQIQQLPTLSPVSPPGDAVEPQRVTQRFPTLSPVTAPAFKDQVQGTLRRFQELSPVTAPTSHNPGNPGHLAYARQSFSNLSPVGTPSSVYRTFRLSDFSGGLNKRDFPTEIADNEVTELVNFVWEGKKLRPRDGFTTYYDMVEFAAGKRIYGLYRYYKQDGSKILLAGASTALYADTNASGSFVFARTGLQEDKDYYFDTFKDKCIVAHEGDYPLILDKITEFSEFGFAESLYVDSYSKSGCTFSLKIRDKNWQPNQWAGYILSSGKFPHNTGSGMLICSNTADTLKFQVNGYVFDWPGGSKEFIFSFFDYDSMASGEIDSSELIDSCTQKLYGSFSAGWCSPEIPVMRMTSGPSKGQERMLYDCAAGYIFLYYPFDTLTDGDDFIILDKVFWKPQICKAYKNRIFFVTQNEFPAGNEFIVFSEANKPTYFDQDNYFTVKTDDGDHITALTTFYDDQLGYKDQSRDCLVIFKGNSIYKLIWNSATDYALVQVVDGIGCVAPKSVVNVEGKYLLFLHTSGIYAFDGRTVIPVYLNIQPLLADSINQNEIDIASAGYCDRHYYLSYPVGTSTENNRGIVFNIDLGVWGETDNFVGGLFAQQNAISDTVKLLFADPRAKSFIYQFGRVETDTGQPISLTLKSKSFNLGDLHKSKRFTYFDLDYYLDSDSVKAWFYTDFGDSLRYSAYVNESGGNRHARIPLDADCLGRNFSFKLTANSLFELGSVAFKFREIGE